MVTPLFPMVAKTLGPTQAARTQIPARKYFAIRPDRRRFYTNWFGQGGFNFLRYETRLVKGREYPKLAASLGAHHLRFKQQHSPTKASTHQTPLFKRSRDGQFLFHEKGFMVAVEIYTRGSCLRRDTLEHLLTVSPPKNQTAAARP